MVARAGIFIWLFVCLWTAVAFAGRGADADAGASNDAGAVNKTDTSTAANGGKDSTVPAPREVRFGGRFEYHLRLDGQANPYPWNASAHAATDQSRFMLDFRAFGTRYGSLYLKGAAYWGLVGRDETQKRFRFDQGDYLWGQDRERFGYSVRLFANERRFFVGDMIAPLIYDDLAGETGGNAGVRVDAATRNGLDATILFSLLSDDTEDAPSMTYLRAAFSHRLGTLSASYLLEDPGARGVNNHAIAKAELVTGYKKAFVVLSLEQSGYKDSGWFFPSGSWNSDDGGGSGFSSILPAGAAAFGEARLTSLRWQGVGRFRLVWRYEAVREEFVNQLGLPGTSRVGHTGGAYFVADKVSLTGKLRYLKGKRAVLETEEDDAVEASAWAALKNNTECFFRAGIGRIDDGFVYDTKKNYIHGAVRYRVTRVFTGVHVMWKDLDTVYSERRFAWDGKLAINPNWGFHWRFLLRRDFQVGQSALFRLEYRPNKRIFAYVGYGREYYGDNPFVLEDRDIGLTRAPVGQWIVMFRGDF